MVLSPSRDFQGFANAPWLFLGEFSSKCTCSWETTDSMMCIHTYVVPSVVHWVLDKSHKSFIINSLSPLHDHRQRDKEKQTPRVFGMKKRGCGLAWTNTFSSFFLVVLLVPLLCSSWSQFLCFHTWQTLNGRQDLSFLIASTSCYIF